MGKMDIFYNFVCSLLSNVTVIFLNVSLSFVFTVYIVSLSIFFLSK